MACSILWFNSSAQKVETKIFEGLYAFEDAIAWGRKTLENFNVDMVHIDSSELSSNNTI